MRSYHQFCALARALDVVGERWTLLLLRELMPGPRRFQDLLDGLPGIGPNLLSARLRRLEEEGVVTRERLDPPAASHVYRLTQRGRNLDAALVALARWGMDPMEPPRADDRFVPASYALALRAAFQTDVADRDEDYEFRIDDAKFHLSVRAGRPDARQGESPDPAVVIEATTSRFLAIITGASPPRANELDERQPGAFKRLLAACRLPATLRARAER